jgi:hypothetical protein
MIDMCTVIEIRSFEKKNSKFENVSKLTNMMGNDLA